MSNVVTSLCSICPVSTTAVSSSHFSPGARTRTHTRSLPSGGKSRTCSRCESENSRFAYLVSRQTRATSCWTHKNGGCLSLVKSGHHSTAFLSLPFHRCSKPHHQCCSTGTASPHHTHVVVSKTETAPFQTRAHARSVLENVLVCLTIRSPLAAVHGRRHVDAEVRILL